VWLDFSCRDRTHYYSDTETCCYENPAHHTPHVYENASRFMTIHPALPFRSANAVQQDSTQSSAVSARKMPRTGQTTRNGLVGSFNTNAIDLGLEPPIDNSGEQHPMVDRRGVSLRWLAASALVGSVGAALIASALYIASDGISGEPEMPEKITSAIPDNSPAQATGRKGDKLVAQATLPTARQVVRAPMSQRVGDKESIKVRPFVRLATNLSLTSGVYATDIPVFNALKMFAEGSDGPERYGEIRPDVTDADFSVVKRDLSTIDVQEAAGSAGLSDAEVIAQIEEERLNAVAAGRRAPLPIPAQLMLSRTLRPQGASTAAGDLLAYAPSTDSRFQGLDVRIVPENVTQVAKTPILATREPLVDERTVVIKRGESFEGVMRVNGATPDQTRSVAAALAKRGTSSIPEGQVLQIMIAPGPRDGDARQVVRVTMITEGRIEAIAAISDRGGFVNVAPPRDEEAPKRKTAAGEDEDEDEEETGGTGARLYDSIYETALKNDMPRPLVDDLIRIFSYDVDFQRRVSGGDSLEVVYTDSDEGEGSRTEILFAALSLNGEMRRVFRFQAPEDGLLDFFDEEGRSLKKFLLRKPITDGEMRSGFGMRFHPILRYSKMHTGVDWANRIGTPILAAGNGKVVKAGWDSGYGRRVEIEHANGYMTTYNHMSAFGRGVTDGTRVRQGQVIGYLGSSGLSTGPHLHYEVMVNGNFVNPMKIKVPRGRELEGRTLAEFKRQRDEIDSLIVRAGGAKTTRAASLR
jgi:murein DD-endopeptidase MepM/ murein hydrolase activator NlpD